MDSALVLLSLTTLHKWQYKFAFKADLIPNQRLNAHLIKSLYSNLVTSRYGGMSSSYYSVYCMYMYRCVKAA